MVVEIEIATIPYTVREDKVCTVKFTHEEWKAGEMKCLGKGAVYAKANLNCEKVESNDGIDIGKHMIVRYWVTDKDHGLRVW